MTQTYATVKDVTCPFCGLLCDDLTVQTNGPSAKVVQNGCAWAVAGFAQQPGTASASIQGRPCTVDLAIQRAVQILIGANQPLIAGLATDAAGCRAAMALAEKAGAAVDHLHGNAISSNAVVMQRRGWIMTTLTEVRNRADLVVLFGTDGDSVNPRFIERCLRPRPGMGRNRNRPRKVVFIGEAAEARALKRALPAALTITCRKQNQLDLLAALRALANGQPGSLPRSLAGKLPSLKRLAELLRSANYSVCAWAPGQLLPDQADIVIESICGLVTALNEHTRAAGLALGGSDGAVTAMNVCAWQTGYPLRVNFAGGAPEYIPSRNATDALLQRREADALVWISTFHPLPPPGGLHNIPRIVLAPPSRKLAGLADVYFPVSTPGVDAGGTMFRLDSVVGLPLRQVRSTSLPSAAEILNRISGKI
ncbi:MAG: hypothetical protein A3H91_14615 [Gammaproteobacteria bacterium RIFCSPLOWO2_02_FULL_61_13]|nr:MAG: hypothetical protein A3H91_14615 [Gammaproteobacteria bacterium RIFCSPLOWO2_02_FULL_61_13]